MVRLVVVFEATAASRFRHGRHARQMAQGEPILNSGYACDSSQRLVLQRQPRYHCVGCGHQLVEGENVSGERVYLVVG
jgi:hypothetical protein